MNTASARSKPCARCEVAPRTSTHCYCQDCQRQHNAEWRRNNRHKARATSLRYRTKIRKETLAHYGNTECAHCGVTDPRVLDLDHINNDGAVERRKHRDGGTTHYARLKAAGYPEGYQVLCRNCNWIKHLTHTQTKE